MSGRNRSPLCRRLQARPADSRRTAAQGKPTLPFVSSTSWGSRAAYWVALICRGTAGASLPVGAHCMGCEWELLQPSGPRTATGPCRCCARTAGSRIAAVPVVLCLATACEGLRLARAPRRTGHCGGRLLRVQFRAYRSRRWRLVVLAILKPPATSVLRQMRGLAGTCGR
jgi:hypothetical protein